jgi:hypothetical protein
MFYIVSQLVVQKGGGFFAAEGEQSEIRQRRDEILEIGAGNARRCLLLQKRQPGIGGRA